MDDVLCLFEIIQDRLQFEAFKTSIDDAGHGFAVVAGEVKEHSSHVASAMGQ